jgi:putative oxidoreductase
MEGLRDFVALVGRILLVLIFLLAGFGKLMGPAGTIQLMGGHGVPFARVAYGLTILIEFGGALLVIAGFKARWAAIIMFLWFIPVTLMFHVIPHFQAVHQGQAMMAMQQQINYMKNISIMGGLLMLAAMGPGGFSLDGRATTEAGAVRRAA